jgi:hypothetical protein
VLVLCLLCGGCSQIDATADPTTGVITSLRYRGFIRQYDASLVVNRDGSRAIIIGARSELDKVMELMKILGPVGVGALTGGAGGTIP